MKIEDSCAKYPTYRWVYGRLRTNIGRTNNLISMLLLCLVLRFHFMVSKTRVTKIKCLAEPRKISARILRCFHQVGCYNFELPASTMRCLSVRDACYFWMSSTILSTVSFIHLLSIISILTTVSIISITVTYAKFASHSRNINSDCFQ